MNTDSRVLSMEAIYERDCDFLLVEELGASVPFLRMFLDALPNELPHVAPDSCMVRHSVGRDGVVGETDLEVRVEWNGRDPPLNLLLLIENKIDADFTEAQPERYAAYAQRVTSRSEATLAFTILTAPEGYLRGTDAKFDARISYESMILYFRDRELNHADAEMRRRSAYRREWFEQAIHKYRRGPAVGKDDAATAFWTRYWEVASSEFEGLRMEMPPEKSIHATSVRFSRALQPPRGFPYVEFDHDLRAGRVSIAIEQIADLPEDARTRIAESFDTKMYWRATPKTLGVAQDVPALNVLDAPDGQEAEIRVGVQAAEELRQWWEDSFEVIHREVDAYLSSP